MNKNAPISRKGRRYWGVKWGQTRLFFKFFYIFNSLTIILPSEPLNSLQTIKVLSVEYMQLISLFTRQSTE